MYLNRISDSHLAFLALLRNPAPAEGDCHFKSPGSDYLRL